MDSGKTVVVLGGGPCGLCAAWELAGEGHKVTVLEKEPQLGGQCRTNEFKGYRFDLGGHRFISKDNALVERIRGLMGDELLVSERRSTIRFRGKNLKYPLDFRDILFKMNPLLSVSCLLSYISSRLRNRFRSAKESTLEDWLVNRYGMKLYEIFFKPYSTKLWGIPPSKISPDWASQRISLLNLSDVILRLLKLRKGTPRTYAIKYYYPKKGIGDIFRRIGREVESFGGEIVLNAEATRVNVVDGAVKSVEYVSGGRTQTIDADYVVSTLPLPELVRMLTPTASKEARDASDALVFRSLRFMNILLDGVSDISPYTWWYLQDGKYIATRLQEPKRRSPYSAPDGKTSVMLEIPCSQGDDIWSMGDKALFERCFADLEDMGLDLDGKVVDYFTTRLVHAYPVYTTDYRKNRDFLIEYVRRIRGIVSCGRGGLFDYIFMDDAMLLGFKAAEVALGKSSPEVIYDRLVDRELLEVKSVVTDEG